METFKISVLNDFYYIRIDFRWSDRAHRVRARSQLILFGWNLHQDSWPRRNLLLKSDECRLCSWWKRKESLSFLPHLYLIQLEFSHKRLDSPIRIRILYFPWSFTVFANRVKRSTSSDQKCSWKKTKLSPSSELRNCSDWSEVRTAWYQLLRTFSNQNR